MICRPKYARDDLEVRSAGEEVFDFSAIGRGNHILHIHEAEDEQGQKTLVVNLE